MKGTISGFLTLAIVALFFAGCGQPDGNCPMGATGGGDDGYGGIELPPGDGHGWGSSTGATGEDPSDGDAVVEEHAAGRDICTE